MMGDDDTVFVTDNLVQFSINMIIASSFTSVPILNVASKIWWILLIWLMVEGDLL